VSGPRPDRTGLPPNSRTDARERALELVYEAECKNESVEDVLASLPVAPDPFAASLARGIDEHYVDAIDLIRRFARADWPVERMPVLDRLVLCLAIEELDHHRDTPRAVVLDEAVEMAKKFSTEDSGRFVNGMLTSIADHLGR
jgi:transcription antitermination protein NusB